jgi:hypothetical protein
LTLPAPDADSADDVAPDAPTEFGTAIADGALGAASADDAPAAVVEFSTPFTVPPACIPAGPPTETPTCPYTGAAIKAVATAAAIAARSKVRMACSFRIDR